MFRFRLKRKHPIWRFDGSTSARRLADVADHNEILPSQNRRGELVFNVSETPQYILDKPET
jgi:hypothetical protein